MFRPEAVRAPLPAGETQVLDGMTAVAIVETALAESAALGASFPAATGARAWTTRVADRPANEFGGPLTSLQMHGPRQALASAVGMALAGQRATAFVSGADLDAAGDVLAFASGQRAPLVVHVALRATPRHAPALGSGHEAWHAAADRGAILLMATSVQDAVDLAVIGRRVAERLLRPVLIGMDGESTALAAQDVVLPTAELLRELVGDPADQIAAPDAAQRMVFGDRRRRVPRPFDAERPMLLGPRQGPEVWGVAAAGQTPFLDGGAAKALDDSCAALTAAAGRSCDPLVTAIPRGVETIIVAQGSAVETTLALAGRIERGRPGIIGVRALRPLAQAKLAGALGDASTAVVLERLDIAPGDGGPLMREIRAVLDRCRENDRAGREVHRGLPALTTKRTPRLVGVSYGLGGLPLRVADLDLLLKRVEEANLPEPGPVRLGIDAAASSPYPKRQALVDAVHRDYPELRGQALRSHEPPIDVRPEGATTIAIHRAAGGVHETLAGELAGLLHGVRGGHVRSRPGLTWQRHDAACVDRVTHAPESTPLLDPGDDVPADIVVLAWRPIPAPLPLARTLTPGATVLLPAAWTEVPESVRDALRGARATVHVVEPGEPDDDAVERSERLLGGLMALLGGRNADAGSDDPKIVAARETMLEALGSADRERRIEAFRVGVASLRTVDASSEPTPAVHRVVEPTTPLAVRRPGRREPTIDSLPRFWDQVGVLYQDDETDAISPDPCLSFGAMPALSSCFRRVGREQRVMVAFDPATCDGHGEAWSCCPDGSVMPLVLSPRALIDAGLELAAEAGRPADALRGVAAGLAKRAGKIVASGVFDHGRAGELLRQAFETIVESAADSPERRATLEAALDAIVDAVGELPVARTTPFFDDAEALASGSGELFALIPNPDTCKSPELVLEAAADHGLRAVLRTDETVEAARRLVRLWERLPDVSGATITRVREHPDVGPLAAMMLSRSCLLAMAGGDGAEAGSGAKLALRQILGVAEFHLQPRLQAHLQQLESLRGRLADTIREILAEALPTGDLDVLGEGLRALGRDDVDLGELSRSLDQAVLHKHVDGARLGRLVEAARGLANLHWRLTNGPDGLGRSRVALALAGGSVAAWSAVFPFNPFAAPAALDAAGEPTALARGLAEGHLQHAVSGYRLQRWAELELDRPVEAARAAERLQSLRFADLTAEERATVPPLMLVGDGADLGRHISGLIALLDSGLPIKIVALSGFGGDADGALSTEALGDYPAGERFDLALLALLGRRAYVAQTSVADGGHFAASVLGAFEFDGPALLHVHAPSPQRHGFSVAGLCTQARRAVACRAVPLIRFDPATEGVFGSHLDLAGNPTPEATWHVGDSGRPLTPVDWAVSERRFAEHVRRLEASDPTPTPIAEYLELAAAERRDRTPIVTIGGAGDGEVDLVVGPALVTDTQQRRDLWRTLQELAGVVTPFTSQVRAAAERDLESSHRRDVEDLRRRHEQELAELRQSFEAEAVQRVTRGLMSLAGYDRNGTDEERDA